mmetsp:Transcript_25092/g.75321  ORF Transcript_25092/g.75321 Transcript_25092/m.75321 type:complete len:185 (-) Transcript_25092:28-582(-)
MVRGLAIFDFDCTLTKFHVWGKYRNAPLEEVPITEDTFCDIQALRNFVQTARAADIGVAIATFGRRDVVDKALTVALGEGHGVEISTPADHLDPQYDRSFAVDEDDIPRCREGSDILGDKNVQIDALCSRVGVGRADVFLADDDPNNIARARAAGICCEHTPQGCDKQCFGRILTHFRALRSTI